MDQAPRIGYTKTNSKLVKRLYSNFAHVTAKANRLILRLILNRSGWPVISRYGQTASEAAFYIVQHAPHAYMEQYAHLMRDAVCQNEASLKHFAMLQDRLLTHRGKKQLYGTQYTRQSSQEDFKLWPVVKPAQLDERRAKMGLSLTREDD